MTRDIQEYHPHIVPGKYFNRYLAWRGFVEGAFTVGEFMSLFFFPGKWRKKEVSEKRYHFEEAYWKGAMREFLNDDGSITLFGKPFFTADGNYAELRSLVSEMIVSDQYATGEFMKDGDTVVDAGANIGMFSVKVAHDFPHAKIYAFEPSRRTFEVLKQNTAFYPNIVCINRGLGELSAEKTIQQKESEAGGARMADSPMGALRTTWETVITETASITTIDTAVQGKIDFIKVDTEGYEAPILKGAVQTIREWKPVIAMSAYHNTGDREKLSRLLRSIEPSYVCAFRNAGGENLICHCQRSLT